MDKKISILFIEDVAADAELALIHLSMNGISHSHSIVDTRKDFIDALVSHCPDLILSDYALPFFDSLSALALRNEIAPDVPFIIFTGSLDEELAVQCIRAGADDFVLKSNIIRLVPAIRSVFAKRNIPLSRAGHIQVITGNDRVAGESTAPGTEDFQLVEEKLTILEMAMESAGIGSWVFDLKGNKRYFDSKASDLLGLLPAKFKKTEEEFFDVIHPDDKAKFRNLLSAAIEKKSDFKTEFRVILPDGETRFLTARAKPVIGKDGLAIRLIGLVWDITVHKLLQMKLQENIRRTNSIVNNLDGAFYRCRYDENLTMEYVSEGIKDLTGYPSWDFLNNRTRSYSSIIHDDDRSRVREIIESAVKKRSNFTVEYRIIDASGNIKWIWERGKGIITGRKPVALEGFFTDISVKKKTEEDLKSALEQQHQLTQHIEKVRENERVAISRELHDDLGQSLTAVKIDLGTIRQVTHEKEIAERVIKLSNLVSETIKTVQRLTSQLRPQLIDDLGLVSAIEWYIKEYQERSHIDIGLDLDQSINLSPDTSLIFFRVMQESLTNVARHANATKVSIFLGLEDDNLILRLTDNGIGISEDQIKARKSFGIISMKERAASMGGLFDIRSREEGGTAIQLIFPLNKTGKDENSYL